MTKKTLLVIGMLVIIGIALFLVFGQKTRPGSDNTPLFSLRDYLPFGETPTSTSTPETPKTEVATSTVNNNTSVPRIRKISDEPVSGAVIFNVGSTTLVRFVEKGTGNVYEANSESTHIERLTNTTIPKIVRSFWLPNGNGFIAQTLIDGTELIDTSFVKLTKTATSSDTEKLTDFETKISKLPVGIKELSIRPDSQKIFFYVIENNNSKWFIADPDGTKSQLVKTSSLNEWFPVWPTQNTVAIQNKTSANSPSNLYYFDLIKKTLTKTGVVANGLSSNPNSDFSFTLYSSGGQLPTLSFFDNKQQTKTQTRFKTLAEKCVWSKKEKGVVYCAIPKEIPAGIYPDDWYKGLAQTNDVLAKIVLDTNTDFNLSSLEEETDRKIDVADLQISKDESHLVFINKSDGYLWLFRVKP